MITAHIGKYIFGVAQDIFKPLPVELGKGSSSNSRQGATPSHSSVADTIAKTLKQSRRIITRMVRRVQDESSRCTHIFLYIWSTKNCHLPRYFRRPRLDMHQVVFLMKGKCLRACQRHTKLQRRSPILLITFIRKNGDGVALKTIEKYHGCNGKISHKIEQHNKEDSCKMILLSSDKRHGEVTIEESRDQKALHNINSLQSFA
ncbi:hypothetical protein ACFX2B_042862 [Malus domestica]